MVTKFTLKLIKRTNVGLCYREAADRIGRIYLPEELAGGERVTIEVAVNKVDFSDTSGYLVNMVKNKETAKKFRFQEAIGEPGEVSDIYISKDVFHYLGVDPDQGIAVRICPTSEQEKLINLGVGGCEK